MKTLRPNDKRRIKDIEKYVNTSTGSFQKKHMGLEGQKEALINKIKFKGKVLYNFIHCTSGSHLDL